MHTGCPSRGTRGDRVLLWGSRRPEAPCPHQSNHARPPPLPSQGVALSQPPRLLHLLLHLSHVFQEDAALALQDRGGVAAKEDPALGQVSQHQPHQLTQVQTPNHLLKPTGRKGGWPELCLSPQPSYPHLQELPKRAHFLWGP